MAGPRALRRWVLVGALLALGAAVRVCSMFYGTISGDDATIALVAKHVLSGENFPVFIYRQAYMGSLNGVHLVPALSLFGPSVLLVRLNAVAWSLLFPLGLYLLARRIFDESSGRMTLALASLPPFLLTYWSTVAEPHLETNVFGVWLLLLALAAITAPSEPARTRALAVLGLLSGLAAWTSFKIVVILGPILVLLLVRGPRLLLGRGGALLAAGFVLGSLPAWLFYAVHSGRPLESSASVGHLLRIDVDLSLAHLRALWTDVILALLGTYHWEPDTWPRWAALVLNCVIYVLGVGFALSRLVRATRARRDTRPSVRMWGLGLLLLTLAASLGALYFSSHATTTLAHAARYALPAYIPLLACTGTLVAWVIRRSRTVGAGLLAFLLLFAAWTHAGFFWPLLPTMRAKESAARSARNAIRERLDARPVEALYFQDTLGALAWAFLLDHPTVSALHRDVYVPAAVAADAAERIDILGAKEADGIATALTAVGATWETTPILGWRLFEGVRVPERRYRMVPRQAWRVAGDPRVPPSVADGNLLTAWRPSGLASPPDHLALDLGDVYRLARVIFWPSSPTSEVFPLRISGSDDGLRWEVLGTAPALAREPTFVASGRPVFRPRNGWLELALTSWPLRYLRLEPADPRRPRPWDVAELHAYEAASAAPPGRLSTDVLVERLHVHGVRRLLADPVVSARVSRATGGGVSTLVANGTVDNHGQAPPELLADRVRLHVHDGLLVPIEELAELRQRLELAGAQYIVEPLGEYALLRVVAPLTSTAPCRATSRRGTTREPAGDGPRVTLEAALGDEAVVSGMRLWHPAVSPARRSVVRVEVSPDGRDWQPVEGRAVPQWGWAGRTLFAAGDERMEIVVAPTRARHVRVVVSSGADEPRLLCVRSARVTHR